jgi:hypothetical protein
MIYNNVELHNVEELTPAPDKSGVILNRFPLRVTEALKGRGSFIARSDTGCEIRFVTSATTVWVTMEAMVKDVELTVFCGDYFHSRLKLEQGKKTTFQLNRNDAFDSVSKEILASLPRRFSHSVWRIYISTEESYCIFYDVNGLDGTVRPPLKNETPKRKWLAYGSSITHGACTADTSNSYIQHTARLLNADVMCKGMSGSCFCEKEVANYIANAQWDFATLEIGANMYCFKTKDFKKRIQYVIETVHEAQPDRKVFVITPFANYNSFGLDKDTTDKHKDYVEILNEAVTNLHSENVRLIDGGNILDSCTYLSCDLVHPSEYGHARMGENLYKLLKDKI